MDPSTADYQILGLASAASAEDWIDYHWRGVAAEAAVVLQLVAVAGKSELASAVASVAFLAASGVEMSSWHLLALLVSLPSCDFLIKVLESDNDKPKVLSERQQSSLIALRHLQLGIREKQILQLCSSNEKMPYIYVGPGMCYKY